MKRLPQPKVTETRQPDFLRAFDVYLDEVDKPTWHRPKLELVCLDGDVVGEATVTVPPEDPNWYRNIEQGFYGVIQVKRRF